MQLPTLLEGIQRNQKASEYHAQPALSSTMIRNLLRSPQHAEFQLQNPVETKALTLGEAVHTAILEPTRFKKEYIKAPKARKGSKEHNGFLEANPNKMVLTPKEFDDCVGMEKAVRNHPTAKQMLRRATGDDVEVSVYGRWFGEVNVLPVRCRCDVLLDNAIIDIKSTTDASPSGFTNAVANYGYHIQAAFYQAIVRQFTGEHLPFRFVAVEKTAPYLVGVYELDDDSLSYGYEQVRRAISIFERCREDESFDLVKSHDGYGLDVRTISIPQWKINQEAINE
jgi:hypothetical protein